MSTGPAETQADVPGLSAALPTQDPGQDVEAGETISSPTHYQKLVADVAWYLKHPRFHTLIIAFTLIDAICVFIDLAYTLLRECSAPGHHERPVWVEVFAYISIVIVSAFLLEIPVTIWALGIDFYNPFKPGSRGEMHLFDAVVIISTFVLEVALRGKDQELAGLLVILRLWRLFELAEGIALSSIELHEQEKEQLEEELRHLRIELRNLKDENQELRKRRNPESDPFASPKRQEPQLLAGDDDTQLIGV